MGVLPYSTIISSSIPKGKHQPVLLTLLLIALLLSAASSHLLQQQRTQAAHSQQLWINYSFFHLLSFLSQRNYCFVIANTKRVQKVAASPSKLWYIERSSSYIKVQKKRFFSSKNCMIEKMKKKRKIIRPLLDSHL